MNSKAVFAGTFDPFTLGHYEIAVRASKQFSKLYIAVADGNQSKSCRYNIKKRVKIAKLSLSGIKNVVVVPFKGFLVDFMRENGIGVMVRGLRNATDFDYEHNLFNIYKSQDSSIEACYFMSGNEYAHISSSLVRDITELGGDIEKYVRKEAIAEIK